MSESETYDLFQRGRAHLMKGMAAQASVSLEKAKKREPDKASTTRLKTCARAYETWSTTCATPPKTSAMMSGEDERASWGGARCWVSMAVFGGCWS